MELKIQVKQTGRKADSLQTHTIKYPNPPKTVRELLILTVNATLKNFEKNDNLKGNKKVTPTTAVETALEAFQDGLVVLFIDDKRYENPDEPLTLQGNETLTFVRLTMLAGRMW